MRAQLAWFICQHQANVLHQMLVCARVCVCVADGAQRVIGAGAKMNTPGALQLLSADFVHA
jgi:hypothetical protein